MLPIISSRPLRIQVVYVYGTGSGRHYSYFDALHFWKSGSFWILSAVFFVSTTALYFVRRLAGFRVVSFVIGFMEVFAIVFGGGNVHYRHRLERWFFAIAMIASFFLVSLYLAEFSMNIVLREPQKIDTFAKLAKKTVPFFLSSHFAGRKSNIIEMLE